uniref:Secreted protein n=1 Tax=Anopheles maculatus TaxID=74869 RepID=A0A182S6N2_9DIPT
MKSKLKISSVVICLVLLICSSLLAVECAPIIENDPAVKSNLHMLPLEQTSTASDSLSSFESLDTTSSTSHSRSKRAIIFRPLFVYRQQQIKKQRVQNPLTSQTVR